LLVRAVLPCNSDDDDDDGGGEVIEMISGG